MYQKKEVKNVTESDNPKKENILKDKPEKENLKKEELKKEKK